MSTGEVIEPSEIYGPAEPKPPLKGGPGDPPVGLSTMAGMIGGGLMGLAVAGEPGAKVGAALGFVIGIVAEIFDDLSRGR